MGLAGEQTIPIQKGRAETRQGHQYEDVMRLHEAAPKLIVQERVGVKKKTSSYWPVPELTRAKLALGQLHDRWEMVTKQYHAKSAYAQANLHQSFLKKRCKGKCHNCGKMGHCAKERRSMKKDKDERDGTQATQTSSSKPENKPVGSANATVIHDFEGDGFWMVEETAIDLAPLAIAEPDPLLGALDNPEAAPHWEGEETMLEEELAGAVITQVDEGEDNRIRVELYDSGATRHISPYRSDVISYAHLTLPAFLNTANQQQFPAIGHA